MKKITTFNNVNDLAKALVNASPVFGNAYAALYALAEARSKFGADVTKAAEAVKAAEADCLMATSLEQLKSFKDVLKLKEDVLEEKSLALAEAIAKQDKILGEVHEEADFAALYKTYKTYASRRTPERKSDYLQEAATLLFDLAGLKHGEDWSRDELDVIEAYCTLNVGRDNVYKNKYATKALSVKAFSDFFLRSVIDRLLHENVLDTSKYKFTSKKLTKLEEAAKNTSAEKKVEMLAKVAEDLAKAEAKAEKKVCGITK